MRLKYKFSDPYQLDITLETCQELILDLAGRINSGIYRAQQEINVEGFIGRTQSVQFIAGESINLFEGFEVPFDAELDVLLESCLLQNERN